MYTQFLSMKHISTNLISTVESFMKQELHRKQSKYTEHLVRSIINHYHFGDSGTSALQTIIRMAGIAMTAFNRAAIKYLNNQRDREDIEPTCT